MKLFFGAMVVGWIGIGLPALAQEETDADIPEITVITHFVLSPAPSLEQKVVDLLKNHISVFTASDETISTSELRLLRFSVRKEIADILATEGYFSPTITFEARTQADRVELQTRVEAGPITKISSVDLSFIGSAITPELQQTIRDQWSLPVHAVFRDEAWTQAKNQALESLTKKRYVAAKISDSAAVVQDEQAALSLELDSGPIFYYGDLHVQGLNLYPSWLLERYHPPVKGMIYNRDELLKFQRELQNSPYFQFVTVSMNTAPEAAAAAEVEILVNERKEYDIGLGAGYSSNTGARGEVSFRDRDFYNEAYDLRSVIRIEQLRQIGYADIYLPPRLSGYLDSFGVLTDRTDIAGLVTLTNSFGAKRMITKDSLETRYGLSFVYEESKVSGNAPTLARALVDSIGWTWREVNNVFEPRQGHIMEVDLSGAAKAVLSDQNFVRLYGKYQRWIPVGTRDVVLLRFEGGYVVAPSRTGIPEDYLFRAGGTGSVRGYAYQSLGINQNNAIVGGRVLTTLSAEYVHWIQDKWGVAGFIDTGDAADTLSALHLNQAVGVGARYKTLAGPIAVDLAYGRETKNFRLDFSIGIAF